MKAMVLHGPGMPLRLETVPVPTIGPNGVVLRVRATGVGLTVVIVTAVPGRVTSFPRIHGHEVAGEVVEVGGMHDDRMVTTTIFGPGPDGRAVPRHLPERLRDQLLRAGYDPRLLTGYIQLGDDNHGAWTTPLTTLARRR